MNILVVGSGAREHALCWKLGSEPGNTLLASPGNPGIAGIVPVAPVPATDIDGLLALARDRDIDLTVVGPETPLAAGLTDRFHRAGLRVFGPTRAAAQLETSKAFAKAFMRRHGVPTARFVVCESAEEARRAVNGFGLPVVLKADGLAAGKGVVVAEDRAAANAAIEAAMVARAFGDAGARLVVEECLCGEEVSFFALCDGRGAVTLSTAQDHKRVFDADAGPNTGGMGAFSPSPLVDGRLCEAIESQIVWPVVEGMAVEGMPFCGVLYAGLMLTAAGPQVIEFNVRFGDPETQVVLPTLAEPLAPWLMAATAGDLPAGVPRATGCAVGVVLASGGYPGPFERGKRISGLDAAASAGDVLVFHAGTAAREGVVVTDGGRVVTIVGRGSNHRLAMERAYAAARLVQFDGMHYRKDIGNKAIERFTGDQGQRTKDKVQREAEGLPPAQVP